MKADSLKRQTVTGIIWHFTELVVQRGVGGLTTLVLAWFLVPDQFGLIAMLAVFLEFGNVVSDAGFSQALIRKTNVSLREYDTAFYANIAISIFIYFLLFGFAPQVASFYGEEQLVQLIRVSGLAVVFGAFSVVQRAVLSRTLKFKLQLRVSFPAAFLSGVIAIIAAYLGLGVWALVIQLLLYAILNAVFYWCLDLWRPGFQFGWREFKELFSFGGFILLAELTRVPFNHIYVIVIAKLFAAPVVGLYYFSEKLRDVLVRQLATSIQNVTYPSLSRLQGDTNRLKNGYRQVVMVMTFVYFPSTIFLAAFADPLFHLILPEKWWPAGIYLQLMCLASLWYPLNATGLNILKVKGRSDLVFYLSVLKNLMTVTILAISFRYGIIGILVGQILNSILAYIPNSYYSKRLIGYSIFEQVEDYYPGLVLAGTIGGILWWLQKVLPWTDVSKILILGVTGVVAYLLVAYVFKFRSLKLTSELATNKFG